MTGPRRGTQPGSSILADSVRAEVEELLGPVDDHLERTYPGASPARQPVHTVYVPADRYRPGLTRQWGQQALAAIAGAAPTDAPEQEPAGMDAFLDAAGIRDALRPAITEKVARKLVTEPIEDLRIDFEDGYTRPGSAEDDEALAAAQSLRADIEAGQAAPFVGIRFKCLERATRQRGLRTLEVFLTELVRTGELPSGLRLTLPKVSAPAQVEAMTRICAGLEDALGLPGGRLRFEVQIETPQAILGADGSTAVAQMVHAGAGRVSGLHYGTYDYSASLGIAGAYQSMEHPAADHAKAIMQLAAAGTGVHLSDGSTNVLPVGSPEQVQSAWALHARLVRRSLERGFYQGWDLHPAQLPTRYAATYAFYRESMPEAATRLRAYLGGEQGGVLDEPATARALAWFLLRGLDCGGIDAAELADHRIARPDLLRLVGR